VAWFPRFVDSRSFEFGVHLPLIDFGDSAWTLPRLSNYARHPHRLGFRYLCANDHLVFQRPWLDGPTALAAVLDASGDMTIATTVIVPALRGPAATAKLLTALNDLSGGRLTAGVGPGSSAADYALAGLDFTQRWSRFDEAVRALRVLLGKDPEPFHGRFYTADSPIEPQGAAPPSPPLWIASWGSSLGVQRAAHLGDGWLASAYNTTPAMFGRTLQQLPRTVNPATVFPHAISTMWFHVTEDQGTADRVSDHILAPLLRRTPENFRYLGLPIGTPEQCAERIDAYIQAGAQRILLWPIGDEIRQLEAFRNEVQTQLSVPCP
jgi:alkanesulfonate monooxygenase SsuD/methylene tetrahydromethanopterin reductase-like flavin-dependent oxidoreductase (luciferase family)